MRTINTALLNRLAIMEHNNLRNICPFIFKNKFSNNTEIVIPHFYLHNDSLHIQHKEIDGKNEFLWQSVLYFKNGYSNNILFYEYLTKKYNVTKYHL